MTNEIYNHPCFYFLEVLISIFFSAAEAVKGRPIRKEEEEEEEEEEEKEKRKKERKKDRR
jgi:hypothetical protein